MALSARRLGVDAVVIVGESTPLIKVEKLRKLGARVVRHGENYHEPPFG